MREEKFIDRVIRKMELQTIRHLLEENSVEEVAKQLNISERYVEQVADLMLAE
jgi:hypothetical protein